MRLLATWTAMLVGALAYSQYFNQRYDAFSWGLAQGGWDIERSPEGYAVISVSSDADSISPDSSFYHYSVLLTRLDGSGVKIGEARSFRPWHGTTSGWANCSDTIPDGGHVIGGATESLPPAVYEVYLMRLNSLGDTLWTRVFGGPGQYWIGRQVKRTADGGFLIVGDTDASGYVDGFALKTDSSGNEQWRETYGYSPVLLDGFVAVDLGPEATYYCSGTSEATAFNGDHYVARIDSAGDLIWEVRWGGPFSEGATQVTTLSDGQPLICTGNSYGSGGASMRPCLAKLDSSDGSFIWEHEYGALTFSTTLFAAKERPNGDLIACGVSYASGDQQGLLLRTTSEGDSIWMRTYYYQDTLITTGQGRFYDVLPTPDGGFIAAGGAYNPAGAPYPPGYSQDTWVVKVDSMGCIVPGCDGVGVSEIVTNLIGSVSVFPNPAHGQVQVQVDLPRTLSNMADLKLTLVNAAGQVALAQAAQVGSNTVELGALSAGVYYMHLSSNTTWLSGTKLMIE